MSTSVNDPGRHFRNSRRTPALAALLAAFAGAGVAQPQPLDAAPAGGAAASSPAAAAASSPGAAAAADASSPGASAAPRAGAAGSGRVSGNSLRPFGAAPGATAAPWRLALLPSQTKPKTQFSVVDADGGRRALRVEANLSYGNLLHPLKLTAGASARLSWRWKAELVNEAADLHNRGGDDTTLKVCTLWDEPIEQLSFGERQLLRVARSTAGEPVPAATVCYVWDAKLAEGTALDSPFTRRLRYIVLRHGNAPAAGNGWVSEKRDIAADFKRLFGDESPTLPPLVGVAVGADADNTQGHSVGYVADLSLEP